MTISLPAPNSNPPGAAFAAGADGRRLFNSDVIAADVLEGVITEVSELLVDGDLPRDDRQAVWQLLRSLIAMRSQERVAQMERAQGLR